MFSQRLQCYHVVAFATPVAKSSNMGITVGSSLNVCLWWRQKQQVCAVSYFKRENRKWYWDRPIVQLWNIWTSFIRWYLDHQRGIVVQRQIVLGKSKCTPRIRNFHLRAVRSKSTDCWVWKHELLATKLGGYIEIGLLIAIVSWLSILGVGRIAPDGLP